MTPNKLQRFSDLTYLLFACEFDQLFLSMQARSVCVTKKTVERTQRKVQEGNVGIARRVIFAVSVAVGGRRIL
ncbi:hypothetical protein T03_15999 [Trichinella britovi]|uniref:Uncharacterized protein n=1 Tax=Trichinella britovi TaxID=45882 RepID=A0A0V1D8Z3_TRIBR|nr:hypothetical protein T03_15999 [Trichinella britovi]